MADKVKSVITMTPHILYLFFILPWILIYLGLRNLSLKLWSRHVFRKTLEDHDIPRDLIKDLMGSYKEQMNTFSIKSLWKMTRKTINRD